MKKQNKLGDYFKSHQAKDLFYQFYEDEQKKWSIPFSSSYANTQSGRTFYLESGASNDETLLFIHGNGENAVSAKPIHEQFSKEYRVISVDSMWQIGRSEPTKPIDNIRGYDPWLIELLNYFNTAKITIVGFSYGSWIAANFSKNHQNRVKRLILLSPAAGFQPIKKAYFIKLFRMVLFPKRRNFMKFLQFCFGKGNQVSPFALSQMEMQFQLCKLSAPPIAPKVLTDQDLESIHIPVLLLLGSQEGIVDPQKSVARAMKWMAHISTVVIPGASHYLDVTHRDSMLKEVEAFLSSS